MESHVQPRISAAMDARGHFRIDLVQLPDADGVNTSGAALGDTWALHSRITRVQTEAAKRRSCVREHDRDVPAIVEAPEERRDFELISQIERGRRFVEKEKRRRRALRRPSSSLRSADAIHDRCFSPPLSVPNGRSAS